MTNVGKNVGRVHRVRRVDGDVFWRIPPVFRWVATAVADWVEG